MPTNPKHGYLTEPEWFSQSTNEGGLLYSLEHNVFQWVIGVGIVIALSLWVTS